MVGFNFSTPTGCVALNELSDKTACANWVSPRSQSDGDASPQPKGAFTRLCERARRTGFAGFSCVCVSLEGLCVEGAAVRLDP